MPLLDVTELTFDPDFADSFTILRRKETVGVDGVVTVSEQPYRNRTGVVTAGGDLKRETDYGMTTRSITVVTYFQIQAVVAGYQPDIIVWRGTRFLVKHVDPYPQFGRGFYQAEAEAMDNINGAI